MARRRRFEAASGLSEADRQSDAFGITADNGRGLERRSVGVFVEPAAQQSINAGPDTRANGAEFQHRSEIVAADAPRLHAGADEQPGRDGDAGAYQRAVDHRVRAAPEAWPRLCRRIRGEGGDRLEN